MSIKENIASDSKTISRGGASMELVEVVDQVQQAQHHKKLSSIERKPNR
jgi:hypothetical protein